MEQPIYILFLLLVCTALYMRTRVLEERLTVLDRALHAEKAEQVASAHVLELAYNDLRVQKAGF